MAGECQEYLKQVASLMGPTKTGTGLKFKRLLELGKPGVVETYTAKENDRIRKLRKAVYMEKRVCWANCQRAVILYGEPFVYTEGFYCPKGLIPTEHAWLTLNGKVVELTAPQNPRVIDYWGLSIEAETVIAFCRESREHGPLLNDWWLRFKYTRKLLNLPNVKRR